MGRGVGEVWMVHACPRRQTSIKRDGRKDQDMAKGMNPKMGWMGRTAACCLVLAALLAAAAVLVAAAGPAGAAFSGGNGKVAFYRNGDVWTMNADGSGPANLTNTPNTSDDEVEPAWSPDGRKIAFTSDRPGSDSTTVWRSGV